MNIKNPKFNFSEEQSLKILRAANYINKAADELFEVNGMLTSILNSISLDLIDQIGLTEELLKDAKPMAPVEVKITQKEKDEIDDLIKELSADTELKDANDNK
jgi:hypothetical protein